MDVAVFEATFAEAFVDAAAAAFGALCAIVPPTAALAASDCALAALALATSFTRPLTPGATGGGADDAESFFGFNTVNHAAATISRATRAIRKGNAI